MKKVLIIVGAVILAVVVVVVLLRLLTPEDTWIKNDQGVMVQHGKPADVPEIVSIQERVMKAAENLYATEKAKGTDFSIGPCLSQDLLPDITNPKDKWVLDIAHNPRTAVDNDTTNQCSAYAKGLAGHFIELDPSGVLIRMN